MTRLVFALVALTAGACARGPALFRRSQPPSADSVYVVALSFLDSTGRAAALDSAGKYLDVYLAMPAKDGHKSEAVIIRRLVRDAQQLAKVEAALREARSAASGSRGGEGRPAAAEVKARDEESVREIQRLKDELAKANEELERIRKRLANPKPPSD